MARSFSEKSDCGSGNTVTTFVDGVLSDLVPASDRALQFGDGFFETFCIFEDKIPHKNKHLKRIHDSASRLGLDVGEPQIMQALSLLSEAAQQQSGVVKIIFTRGSSTRGYSAESDKARVIASFFPQSLSTSRVGPEPLQISVSSVRLARQPLLAGIKHLNRLENILAAKEMRQLKQKQALLMDTENMLVECVSANLFFIQDSVLHTPDLSFAGVNGVSRAVIMEQLAPSLGLQVKQGNYVLQELLQAEEVFCSNSIQGIVPITTINETSFAKTATTEKLIKQWWKLFYEAAEPAL